MDEPSTSSDPPTHCLGEEGELETTMVPQENQTTTTASTSSSEMVHLQSEFTTALDTEDQVQPTTTTTTAADTTISNSGAPSVDQLPSTAAPQLIEDSLQSDHQVEITVPVMSNEETHVQRTNELEPANGGDGGGGLTNGPQQSSSSFEKDLLAVEDLDELSMITDGMLIDDLQCLPPQTFTEEHLFAAEKSFLEENPPPAASSTADIEQHHPQFTESATSIPSSTTPTTKAATTTTSTASTSFQLLELDEPLKERAQQFATTTGSSAETELIDADDLKEAANYLEDDLDELDHEMDHGAYSQSTTTDAATILDTDSSKDGTVSELPVAAAVSEPEVPDLFKDVKFAISEEMEDLDKVRCFVISDGVGLIITLYLIVADQARPGCQRG